MVYVHDLGVVEHLYLSGSFIQLKTSTGLTPVDKGKVATPKPPRTLLFAIGLPVLPRYTLWADNANRPRYGAR
jgi:hypothetical protein